MKKLIIEYKDYVLKVHASKTNTTIFNSHEVRSPIDMGYIISSIRNKVSKNYAINKRDMYSMGHEWRAHNLLYSLGIMRSRTKDVDLNINQTWYIKMLYSILSLFYFHFK